MERFITYLERQNVWNTALKSVRNYLIKYKYELDAWDPLSNVMAQFLMKNPSMMPSDALKHVLYNKCRSIENGQ